MNLSIIFLFQIIITVFVSILATIYDVKCNIVPLKLTRSLLFFGLISNLILSLISNNIKFILASFISMLITYGVTYLLWELKIWGGGDVKLFTAIATVIPTGLNIDILNIFPKLSIYPFSFSVIINSILVSFPFLTIFLIKLTLKNETFQKNPFYMITLLNIENLINLIHTNMNKTIPIKNLQEGNIINNYYFNNKHIKKLIEEENGNLEVYENKNKGYNYYFKSISAAGITQKEMYLFKIMSDQKLISDKISIKISYPFTPAILIGLLITIFYGDIIMILTKNLALVI